MYLPVVVVVGTIRMCLNEIKTWEIESDQHLGLNVTNNMRDRCTASFLDGSIITTTLTSWNTMRVLPQRQKSGNAWTLGSNATAMPSISAKKAVNEGDVSVFFVRSRRLRWPSVTPTSSEPWLMCLLGASSPASTTSCVLGGKGWTLYRYGTEEERTCRGIECQQYVGHAQIPAFP
jgi:hypothetical protein